MQKILRTMLIASALAVLAMNAGMLFSGHALAATSQVAANPAPAASPYVVHIKNYVFNPGTITVPVGSTVLWSNDDSVAHTVTLTGKDAFDSGNLDGGKSYTHTFNKAGTYNYVCSYHQSMKATVIVSDTKTQAASPTPFVPPSPSGYGY